MRNDNAKRNKAAALRLGSILLVSVALLGGCGKTAAGNSKIGNTAATEGSETSNGHDAEAAYGNSTETVYDSDTETAHNSNTETAHNSDAEAAHDNDVKTAHDSDAEAAHNSIAEKALSSAEKSEIEFLQDESRKRTSENGREAHFDNTTTVVLDGAAFDIQEQEDAVNAITDVISAGSYWIVSGHIGPHNGYYGFYNTETSQWEKEILGSLLTWYGADGEEEIPFSMDTVVYAFWNELYDLDGNLIATIELDESESEEIYSLKRTSTGVEVYIYNGAMEERMVEVEAPVSSS